MRIFAVLLMLLAAFAGASQSFAQETEEPELAAGFTLGKYFMSANMLASDLEIIQALAGAFELTQITDENYESGAITDDDVTGAQMVLGYALWRVQFMVLPVCDAGLGPDSFGEPSIAPYKADTQALLAELQADVNVFLETADFAALDQFVSTTLSKDYAARLTDLAAQAQSSAGVEDEVAEEEAAPAEAPGG